MIRRYVVETIYVKTDVGQGGDGGTARVRYRWGYLMSFDDRRFAEKVARSLDSGRVREVVGVAKQG